MTKRVGIVIAVFLVFAAVGSAQYTMDLTGVGDGTSADGVYVSPYTGSVWAGAYTGGGAPTTPSLYSGYLICDDFSDESYVGDVWNASATYANSLNGSELFTGGNAQQNYDAVAWLANQLLLSTNVNNATAQINYSFAIWDIMDGASTDPDGGASGLISQAFTAIQTPSNIYTNVVVFTPAPKTGVGQNVSQEFLMVNGPQIQTPEPASTAILGVDLLSALAGVFLVLRYRRARA